MNKKNFCINKVVYTIVVGERNYLEYFVQYKTSQHHIRKRLYKGFSVSDDLDELYPIALRQIAILQQKTLAELEPKSKLHEYIENHKYRYKIRTFEQFEGVCTRFTTWCKKNKVIPHKISYVKAREYISESASTRKNGTLWNIQLVLKTIFNGMKKEKICTENPFADLPKIKRTPTSLMYFNSVQSKAIKEYCQKYDTQMLRAILLLYSCGIRPGELRTLQIFDISIEEGFVEVRADQAKGGKAIKVVLPEQLKTLLTILQSYPPHYFVFGKYGNPSDKMVSQNFLNDKHRLILKELKIRGRYALYSWKHTGAVAMVRAGINIKLIQLQLRHSSLDMTNEYLKNLGLADNDDLKNKLPEL